MAEEKNEFEEMDTVSEEDIEQAPTQETSEVSGVSSDEDLVADASGQEYDYTKAPKEGRAPPRQDLDGKEVTIIKAALILPGADKPWEPSKNGKTFYKYCVFKLYYSIDGQQEFYSGVRVFKQAGDKYSHPSIMRDRKNQSSHLLGLYADFKEKHINEVSLHEFMSFLNGQPKAILKISEVKNPTTEAIVKKNMVEKFI